MIIHNLSLFSCCFLTRNSIKRRILCPYVEMSHGRDVTAGCLEYRGIQSYTLFYFSRCGKVRIILICNAYPKNKLI